MLKVGNEVSSQLQAVSVMFFKIEMIGKSRPGEPASPPTVGQYNASRVDRGIERFFFTPTGNELRDLSVHVPPGNRRCAITLPKALVFRSGAAMPVWGGGNFLYQG